MLLLLLLLLMCCCCYIIIIFSQVGKLMSERTDAEEAAEEAAAIVHAASQATNDGDEFSRRRREFLDIIQSKIPLELLERVRRRRATDPPVDTLLSEKALVRLHRQVIRALQNLHRTDAQWADLTKKVFDLEDINRNMISNEHFFKRTSSPLVTPAPKTFLGRKVFNPTMEWYWKCLVLPLLLRVAAGAAAVMSAMLIWSEVMLLNIMS
jgi:hypothetical protein